jgi:hypothetical protein
MTEKQREAGDMSTNFTRTLRLELSDMDPGKCGYADDDELAEAHEQCDLSYIKRNRQFVIILHDDVYPNGSKPTR